MKVTIETNAMIKHGTCIGEVLVLLEILNGVNHAQVLDNLVKKGYITAASQYGRGSTFSVFLQNCKN